MHTDIENFHKQLGIDPKCSYSDKCYKYKEAVKDYIQQKLDEVVKAASNS